MPEDLPTEASQVLTNAERQARHRARREEQAGPPSAIAGLPTAAPDRSAGTPPSPNCSPCRADYAAWADGLRDGLRDTATAEALQAIVELNLSDIEPPRGYGRD